MSHTIELSDELVDRLRGHLDDDQTLESLVEELLTVYETEGAFLQEGYSE